MDLADLRGFGFHLGDQFVHLVEYRLTRFTLRQIDPHLLQLLHRFVIGALLPDNRPMSVAPYPSARLPTHCPNCQAVVYGPFCAQCGQETATEILKLRDFSHEYFQHFVTLEGRLWRSLWMLVTQPGQLTLEFIAGRRRRYVRPIPLYLSLSFVMFLLLTFSTPDSLLQLDGPVDVSATPSPVAKSRSETTGDNRSDIEKIGFVVDKLPAWLRPLGKRYHESAQRFQQDPKGAGARLVQVVTAKLPYAVFLLVPLFAFNTRLLFWRRGRLYSEHFLFAMHLHAFVFLTLVVSFWFSTETAAPMLFWAWWGYLLLALRRVFGGRWWVQGLRALLLIVSHSLLLAVVTILTIVVSLPSV